MCVCATPESSGHVQLLKIFFSCVWKQPSSSLYDPLSWNGFQAFFLLFFQRHWNMSCKHALILNLKIENRRKWNFSGWYRGRGSPFPHPAPFPPCTCQNSLHFFRPNWADLQADSSTLLSVHHLLGFAFKRRKESIKIGIKADFFLSNWEDGGASL